MLKFAFLGDKPIKDKLIHRRQIMKSISKVAAIFSAMLMLFCAVRTASAATSDEQIPKTPFYLQLAQDIEVYPNSTAANPGKKRNLKTGMIIKVIDTTVTPWIVDYSGPEFGAFSFLLPSDTSLWLPEDQTKCANAYVDQTKHVFGSSGSWINDDNFAAIKPDKSKAYFNPVSAASSPDSGSSKYNGSPNFIANPSSPWDVRSISRPTFSAVTDKSYVNRIDIIRNPFSDLFSDISQQYPSFVSTGLPECCLGIITAGPAQSQTLD